MYRRTASLIALIVIVNTLTACDQSTGRWTAQQAITAINAAGLPLTEASDLDQQSWVPMGSGNATVFHIPGPGSGGTGFVWSFASAVEATERQHSNREITGFSFQSGAVIDFTHDNLYVMLAGNQPEATLRKYEAAIKTLK